MSASKRRHARLMPSAATRMAAIYFCKCKANFMTAGGADPKSSPCSRKLCCWTHRCFACLAETFCLVGDVGACVPHWFLLAVEQMVLSCLLSIILRNQPLLIVCEPGYGGSRCSACPANTWSAGGTVAQPKLACTTCPDGTGNTQKGAMSVADCKRELQDGLNTQASEVMWINVSFYLAPSCACSFVLESSGDGCRLVSSPDAHTRPSVQPP